MDFDLNDDQRLLKDTVDKLIAGDYGFEQRRAYMIGEKGYSDAIWSQFAELGLLGLPFSDADGGFGGTPIETMIVMEAFGRGLVVEPFLSTVVIGAAALDAVGNAEQRAAIVPGIVDGSTTLALATTERFSRFDLHDVQVTATRDGAGYVLSGDKGVVAYGAFADYLIVSARTSGGRRDRNGIGLFLVKGDAAGLTRRGYATQDGSAAAEVTLDKVKVGPEGVLGNPENGLPALEAIADIARAALCAEAVGVMGDMVTTTVDYLKTRKQFGVAIGSFQVLQHRAAEMFVELEQARSMAMLAAMSCTDADANERSKLVAAAKVQIGRSGKFIGQQAIQLHGGIGMTMEYKVGHSFKRMTMIDTAFGDADHHLSRVTALGGLVEA
jgi:pimeloyl-CoA dehydrogenase small subunit